MKHKGNRLEYACQYQTMSTKEWRKVILVGEKKFNFDCTDDFRNAGTQKKKKIQERITQQGIMVEDLLQPRGASHLQKNLNYNLSVVDKKQQIM